jgi:hypothetical protein
MQNLPPWALADTNLPPKALAERLAANTCGGIRHVSLFPLSARPVLAIKFEGDHFQQ